MRRIKELFFSPHSISDLLNAPNGQKKLRQTLEYNFVEFTTTDVGKTALENLFQSLLKMKTAGETKDAAYLGRIAEWYGNTTEAQRKYPMTTEAFYQQKTKVISDLIGSKLPVEVAIDPTEDKSLPRRLLDVGCGDCQVCVRVAKNLGTQKTGVDLENPADWGLENLSSQIASMREHKEIVYYDGKDLVGALKKDTSDYTRLYDVVMFNHVLHHYPNFKAQLEGLRQVIELLKPGGIIFFSEHQNVLSDRELRLQHILFDLKTEVTRSKQAHPDDAKAQQHEIAQMINTFNHRKGEQDLYFSNPMLKNILASFGLTLEVQAVKGVGDASETMFTIVGKPLNWNKSMIKPILPFTEDDLEAYGPQGKVTISPPSELSPPRLQRAKSEEVSSSTPSPKSEVSGGPKSTAADAVDDADSSPPASETRSPRGTG